MTACRATFQPRQWLNRRLGRRLTLAFVTAVLISGCKRPDTVEPKVSEAVIVMNEAIALDMSLRGLTYVEEQEQLDQFAKNMLAVETTFLNSKTRGKSDDREDAMKFLTAARKFSRQLVQVKRAEIHLVARLGQSAKSTRRVDYGVPLLCRYSAEYRREAAYVNLEGAVLGLTTIPLLKNHAREIVPFTKSLELLLKKYQDCHA